jgi:hypothetical protein
LHAEYVFPGTLKFSDHNNQPSGVPTNCAVDAESAACHADAAFEDVIDVQPHADPARALTAS